MTTILQRAAHPEVRRVFRFGLTGVAGFLADFGSLVLAHSALHWPLIWSLVLAYTIGGIVHYSLTRWWVFPAKHSTPETGRVLRYLALGAANAVITMIAVPALTHLGMDYRLAKLICVVVLFATNYVLVPRFVMPAAPRDQSPSGV